MRRRFVIGTAGAAIAIAVLAPPAAIRDHATEVALWWMMRSVPRDEPVVGQLAERSGSGPELVLLVGNDTRSAVPDRAEDRFGPLTGERADVIAMLALDERPRLLSLPRNLRAEIPSHGPLTLAEAFGFGGSALLAEAIAGSTGLRAHRYAEVTMGGFADLVDLVGGVPLEFDTPARDVRAGFAVDAGRHCVDGVTALALTRSREYEELRGGEWHRVAWGDLGRIRRQQKVLRSLLGEIRGLSVGDLLHLARNGPAMLTIDAEFGAGTAADMLRALRDVDVEMLTLPVGPTVDPDELVSPFGTFLGGRLYLELGPDAPLAVEWLQGTLTPATGAAQGG